MEREKFMQEARLTAHRILEGKENGIMNLVQQAWAEGKRNAEVETLRIAIDEALAKRDTKMDPVEDAVYPTWLEWLADQGVIASKSTQERIGGIAANLIIFNKQAYEPIPASMAEKLGVNPKEE